jgi:hypothetical protein
MSTLFTVQYAFFQNQEDDIRFILRTYLKR